MDTAAAVKPEATTPPRVDYRNAIPSQYRHWKLGFDGPLATLDAGHRRGRAASAPATSSSSTRYDLGVDIELHDALQRIRFEHPEVRSVIAHERARTASSARAPTSTCSASRRHAFKVNFCKFTNETRNGLEDSSAAFGPQVPRRRATARAPGGGYELALACDEIVLVDDRSSSVSPARGAAARRAARHRRPHARDRQAQGAPRPRRHLLHQRRGRARQARASTGGWSTRSPSRRSSTPPSHARAREARRRERPARPTRKASTLTPLAARRRRRRRCHYEHVDVAHRPRARARRRSPSARRHGAQPHGHRRASRRGRRRGGRSRWRASSTTRSCTLRTNELEHRHVAAEDRRRRRRRARRRRDAVAAQATTGSCARRIGMLRRTLTRLDVIVAHALRADRARARASPARCSSSRSRPTAPTCSRCPTTTPTRRCSRSSELNFGALPMVNGQSRLARRFYDEEAPLDRRACSVAHGRDRRRRGAGASASSRPRPTTSTGTTRSASRSRSARACRPTR